VNKYTDIESTPENDNAWMLQVIANELAEMNRLKRLALSGGVRNLGELEDKA